MTVKEAATLTGWSVTWLKTHECAWCGQSLLRQTQGNCGSQYGGMVMCGERKPWWQAKPWGSDADPSRE